MIDIYYYIMDFRIPDPLCSRKIIIDVSVVEVMLKISSSKQELMMTTEHNFIFIISRLYLYRIFILGYDINTSFRFKIIISEMVDYELFKVDIAHGSTNWLDFSNY